MRCTSYTVEMVNKLPLYKKEDKSHPRYEWAISYLALGGGTNTGINPELFDLAMSIAKTQKISLVNFLIGKKMYDADGVHTKETAVKVADEMFRKAYEREVNSFNSDEIQPYWTRQKLSNIEFGRNIDDFEVSHADGSTSWEQDRSSEAVELTSNEEPVTPWKRKEINAGQLLSYLTKGVKPSLVIQKAKLLLDNKAIGKRHFWNLVGIAGEIQQTLVRQSADQMQDMI